MKFRIKDKALKVALLGVTIICLLTPSNWGQGIKWSTTLGGIGNERANEMALLANGNLVITGLTSQTAGGPSDVYLVSVDMLGDTLWTTKVGGSGSENANGICATADSGFIAVGESNSTISGSTDIYVMKLNSNGDTAWTQTHDFGGLETGNSVVELPSGNMLVLGTHRRPGILGSNIILVAMDSLGNVLWHQSIGGSGDDTGEHISLDAAGNALIVGSSESLSDDLSDLYAARYVIEGFSIWSGAFGGNAADYGSAGLSISADTTLLIGSSSSYGPGASSVFVKAVDSTGVPYWEGSHGSPDIDFATSATIILDSIVLVTGFSLSVATFETSSYLLALDKLGDSLWLKHLPGTGNNEMWTIVGSSDGSSYLAGFETVGTQTDLRIMNIAPYECGDADGSGSISMADVTFLVGFIFSQGPPPLPYHSGDADGSCVVSIADVSYLINYIGGGPAPICPSGCP